MSSALPHEGLPPVVLTERQLRAVVAPLIAGYAWAEGTVGDLWRMGSPMPPAVAAGAAVGEVERLIVPSQFMAWLSDVLTRQGRPLDAAAQLYSRMIQEDR